MILSTLKECRIDFEPDGVKVFTVLFRHQNKKKADSLSKKEIKSLLDSITRFQNVLNAHKNELRKHL